MVEIDNGTYRHCLNVQIRFNDVDRFGHVNNNAYFAYYDLGKEEYLREVMGVDYAHADVAPVIANINADFLLPIFYGDQIVVQTRVAHLGNRSFILKQRAVNQLTGQVVCQCSSIMVCFNPTTQQAADMPAAYREAILRYEPDLT